MRVFVKSFGCSTNVADGELLAGCLAHAGYELVRQASSADIVVYNTCAVKGPTENRMIEALKQISTSKKLIVAGCLPSVNLERLLHEVTCDGIVGPAAADRIVDVANRVSRGERSCAAIEPAAHQLPELTLPRVHSSSVVSIVPISYGCLGTCAYCCVVLARGRLQSYDVKDIVHKVEEDLRLGFREFWLTSQDVACYGRDRSTSLTELLRALCAIEGDFKIRVGMMTPNLVLDMLEELLEAFEDEHVFKFVHLPVQSGDDGILTSMCRFYSASDFMEAANTFRSRFSHLTLATDVICGFPGENEAAFQKSLQLMKQVRPDIVNVSKFFARPKTPAAEMKKCFVPSADIKSRSSRIAQLAKTIALENNRRWVGWKGSILVDEKGKLPSSWIGRNFAYKPTIVKKEESLIGRKMSVEIVRAFPTYLEGELA